MILYDLRCSSGHGFEGWFRNSDAYEVQAERREISCPVCQDTEIGKAPMAPRVSRSVAARNKDRGPEGGAVPETPAPDAGIGMPGQEVLAPEVPLAALPPALQALHLLRGLRRAIETHCENVGNRFAEEARKIHEGEAPARGIFGDATPEEAEALAEDGIEFHRIPWVGPSDA